MKTVKESINIKEKLIKNFFGIDRTSSLNIKKGELVYHITPLDFKRLKPMGNLYISATDYDRNLYKSYLSMRLFDKGYRNVSEICLKLKQDLHSPDKKTQKAIFDHCYGENKLTFLNDLLKTEPNMSCLDVSLIYDLFMKYINKIKGDSINVFNFYLQREGYNTILDYHDIDLSWIQAKAPLYLLNAENFVEIHKVIKIDRDDIKASLKEIGDF